MAKPKAPKHTTDESTVMLSVRLSERERDLLQKAAEVRGWSTTGFLRMAALERGAHMVNAERIAPRLRAQASEVANRLVKHPRVLTISDANEQVEAQVIDNLSDMLLEAHLDDDLKPPVELRPGPMTLEEIRGLRDAAKHAGVGFLRMIVEACDALVAEQELGEPELIDQSSFGKGEK